VPKLLTRAIALVAVLTVALPWGALGDNVIVDGDGLSPVASNPLAFGNVCLNTTPSKTILLDIDAAGHPGAGTNVFANSATLTFAAPTVSAGLSASTPGAITLPSNWTSLGNTAISSASSATASLTASGTGSVGAKSGTVGYSVSGARSTDGTTLTRSASLSASWNVISCDSTPPTLSLPSNMTVEATSSTGAVVSFTATASDANPTNPSVTCTPASGSTFSLGTTTVNCSATDAAGNTATGSFTITVRDTTPPAIANTPADITAEAASSAGAVVTYTNPTATDAVGPPAPGVTCSPASGATFAIGSTTVNCSATDTAGNTGHSSFTVTVHDTIAPVLSLPAHITAEATGPSGASVTFTASASDLVDGSITPTCDATSGDTFPLGDTTVDCSATDVAGNTASGSFTITVRDTTAPAVTVPSNITAEATGPTGAAVTYAASASDLVDGPITPTCVPSSGSTFELGTTTVTCSATDDAGNIGSDTFTITVQDTTAPTISGNTDKLLEATGPGGASATFSLSASDLVDGPVSVTCDKTSGTTFAIGNTLVSCSATDAHGNKATATFTITVRDTTAPAVTVPSNITAEATGPTGAAVTYAASASDLVDGPITPTCVPSSGSTFALGLTTVTCSATDAHSNTGQNTFTVTVEDNTAPTLTLPANITLPGTGTSGAIVTYSASASDLVDGNLAANCTPASGSTFAYGTTTVNCSATDGHGNTATGSFTVTVNYRLGGFYQPVDMGAVVNTVKNGSTVPLKWEMFAGYTELTDVALVSTLSKQITCGTVLPTDDIEVLATGGTSLRYDTTAGQFIFNWQTPKRAGTCWSVTMTAADGSTLVALFKLK
jgi:hypothetical protein